MASSAIEIVDADVSWCDDCTREDLEGEARTDVPRPPTDEPTAEPDTTEVSCGTEAVDGRVIRAHRDFEDWIDGSDGELTCNTHLACSRGPETERSGALTRAEAQTVLTGPPCAAVRVGSWARHAPSPDGCTKGPWVPRSARSGRAVWDTPTLPVSLRSLSLSLLLLGLALVLGCARRPSLAPPYQLPLEEPNGRALTGRFLVIADNQLHHLFGDPFWTRTEIADRVVPTSIRPVQLDLFARDLLRWVLERPSSRFKPILHLGDAADIGCVGEMSSFFEDMGHASAPWFMAPGNHDVYFVGNGVFSRGQWERACERADGPLDKNEFISMYLDQGLGGQDAAKWPGLAALQAQRAQSPAKTQFTHSGEGALLTGVTWHIDDRDPWSSFIVQRLDLSWSKQGTPIIAVLLDSSQFAAAPHLIPIPPRRNAGLTGSVLPNQISAVEELLKDAPDDALVLLVSHHSFDELDRGSRQRVEALRGRFPVLGLLSAHTHAGHFDVHSDEHASTEGAWLELNVGSLIDWPLEYRELMVKEIDDDPDRVAIVSPLHRIHREWFESQEGGTACDPSWELPAARYVGADDGYAVTSHHTQRELFDALFRTYADLLRLFPSEPPPASGPSGLPLDDARAQEEITGARQRLAALDGGKRRTRHAMDEIAALLFRLDRYERQRVPQARERRDLYRRCQAFWASKYDRVVARQPVAEDATLVVPRDTQGSNVQ